MIILDTDAVSHLPKAHDPIGVRILAPLDASSDRDIRITAVTAYEMLGGAIALIDRRKRDRGDESSACRLLQAVMDHLGQWRGRILAFDAAETIHGQFPARLRQSLRDDARIAAIALHHRATVWTCNTADYAKVPGLAVVRAETGAVVS